MADASMSNHQEAPIYHEAICPPKDVYYEGSDDEDYESGTARRKRYEAAGQRYLRGEVPLLLSASLRGPFDKASGWVNPWRSKNRTSKLSNNLLSLSRASENRNPPTRAPIGRQLSRTQDSIECHLPSPESVKHLPCNEIHPYLEDDELEAVQRWRTDVVIPPLAKRDVVDGALPVKDPKKRRAEDSAWLRRDSVKKRKREFTISESIKQAEGHRPHPQAMTTRSRSQLGSDKSQKNVAIAVEADNDELMLEPASSQLSISKRISPRRRIRQSSTRSKYSEDELSPNKRAAATLSSPVSQKGTSNLLPEKSRPAIKIKFIQALRSKSPATEEAFESSSPLSNISSSKLNFTDSDEGTSDGSSSEEEAAAERSTTHSQDIVHTRVTRARLYALSSSKPALKACVYETVDYKTKSILSTVPQQVVKKVKPSAPSTSSLSSLSSLSDLSDDDSVNTSGDDQPGLAEKVDDHNIGSTMISPTMAIETGDNPQCHENILAQSDRESRIEGTEPDTTSSAKRGEADRIDAELSSEIPEPRPSPLVAAYSKTLTSTSGEDSNPDSTSKNFESGRDVDEARSSDATTGLANQCPEVETAIAPTSVKGRPSTPESPGSRSSEGADISSSQSLKPTASEERRFTDFSLRSILNRCVTPLRRFSGLGFSPKPNLHYEMAAKIFNAGLASSPSSDESAIENPQADSVMRIPKGTKRKADDLEIDDDDGINNSFKKFMIGDSSEENEETVVNSELMEEQISNDDTGLESKETREINDEPSSSIQTSPQTDEKDTAVSSPPHVPSLDTDIDIQVGMEDASLANELMPTHPISQSPSPPTQTESHIAINHPNPAENIDISQPQRPSTPEPRFNVATFATFMTPSPEQKSRRAAKTGRACNSTSQLGLRSAMKDPWKTTKTTKQVTWAPLPTELDAMSNSSESHGASASHGEEVQRGRQASPLPTTEFSELPTSPELKFHNHFNAVINRTDGTKSRVLTTAPQAASQSPNPHSMPGQPWATEIVSKTTSWDTLARDSTETKSEAAQESTSESDDEENPLDIIEDMFNEMGDFLETFDVDAELDNARKTNKDQGSKRMSIESPW